MQELIQKIINRASNPKTIHDMAMGLSPAPKIGPKVPALDIKKIEEDLGFKFPGLLKNIYTEIGDGGFGPGYGLYKIKTAVEIYLKSVSSDESKKGKFPVCTWGCAKDSYVNCLSDSFPVYFQSEDKEDDCGCMGNLSFTLKDKNGNVISTGNGSLNQISDSLGGAERPPVDSPKKSSKRKFIMHKKSISDWFYDWVNGVNMWDDMMSL